ncbi:MAG: hypothetical protein B5M49_01220, partial [Thermotoga sp. 4484_232]
SKATVSRVINGSGYVSKETREKILEIIRKYDFVPDSKAVSLSKKKTSTIALILPATSGPFYGEVIRGVEEVLSNERYFILLIALDSGQNVSRSRERYISALREGRVDGAIIFDPIIGEKAVARCRW